MWLEHVNLTVSDLDRSVRFYSELLSLKVRWRREPDSTETPAVHIGDDRAYLALFQARDSAAARTGENADYGRVGFNHVGFVVENLENRVNWLHEHGIESTIIDDYEPGRRAYFFDADGIEVELVEYAGQTTTI
jgi:catechol 2,3-dioxygenase-like lactoylglutathione lyase family enzyme